MQQLADCINVFNVGTKLVESCKQQPDLVPEVVAAARTLLQQDDDGIVEGGCKVMLELCDEAMDIVQEVLPK